MLVYAGVGTALVVPALVIGARRLFPGGVGTVDTYVLTFDGPFTPGGTYELEGSTGLGNRWITLKGVMVSYFPGKGTNVQVLFRFNGDAVPDRRISTTITASDARGRVLGVNNAEHADARLAEPSWHGSVMAYPGPDCSAGLLIRSEVARFRFEFVHWHAREGADGLRA